MTVKFDALVRYILEGIDDDIHDQKGSYHVASGGDSRFFGNRGAGIILYCPETDKFLLGLRSQQVNEPGQWGTFGGKIEDGEDPKEAAIRETREEIDYHGPISLRLLRIFKNANFEFYNYFGTVPREFKPRLDWENSDARWFRLDEFPKNLHFGLQHILPDLQSVA